MVNTPYLKEIFYISPTPSLLLKVDSNDFKIVMANSAFLKLRGIQEDYIKGQNLSSLFSTETDGGDYIKADTLLSALRKVVDTKREVVINPFRHDTNVHGARKDQVRYFESHHAPIEDDSGDVAYVLLTLVEVKEASYTKDKDNPSEDQWSGLGLEAMVWEADLKNFQHTYVGPQSKSMFGYEPEEWYQANFWNDKVSPKDKDYVLNSISDENNHPPTYDLEYRMHKSDGAEIWVRNRISVINVNGKSIKLKGILTDITKRKHAEMQVLENHGKIKKIMDHSLDIICTFDAEGNFIEVNAAAGKLWGYTPEELKGQNFKKFIHPEDLERSTQEVYEVVKGKNTIKFENRYITKDGKTVPMLWSAQWDRTEQLMYCVAKDATPIKEAERQLKNNEQRFKSLVQHGADFIAITDASGNFTYVSPTSPYITGWETQDLVGRCAFSFITEDNVERVTGKFFEVASGKKNMLTDTFRIITKDGQNIWMETYAINMLDNPMVKGIVINARDVTEKKYYIEWHEYVSKATNNAIFDWNISEGIVQWGGNTAMLFKPAKNNFIIPVENITHRIHPEDKEEAIRFLKTIIQNKEKFHVKGSYRIANAEAQYLNVEIDGYFIRNSSGEADRMIGAVRDVTEQKKIENELKIINQRYELVTQATSDAIWDWDLRTDSVYRGGGYYSLFGYKPEELVPHISAWRSRIHPKDFKEVIKKIKNVLNSDQNLLECEYRFLNSDGEYNYVYDRGFVVRNPEGKALRLVGAMQNIHQDKMQEVKDNLKLDIGYIFTHVDKMDSCLQESLKSILQVHEASYAEIWMTDYDNSSIVLRAHYGKGTYIILEDHSRFLINEGLAGNIWAQNEAIFIDSIVDSREFTRKEFAKENNYNSIAGYPVLHNQQFIAVILFFYKKKQSGLSTFIPTISGFLGSEIQRKKAEVELDHFFELSPDLMCITNAMGTYIKINEAFDNLLGYSKEEIISTNFLSLLHPDDRYIFDDMAYKVETGQIMNHESRMRKKSGDYLWLSWTAKPFPGEGLIVAVGKDISEKKLQEEALANSHNKINNILESIQDGFITVEKDWTVSYWNRAAEKMVKLKRDQIIGKNIWNIFPETKELKFHKEFSRAIEDNESVRFDEYYKPLDLWLMVSAFPSETGLTVYLKDVTESKLATQKLIQFKKVIENSKEEIAIISTVNDAMYLNPAFTESFGYGAEKLKQIGGAQEIFANETQAAEVFYDLLAGRHWKGDVELKNSSNKIRSYYISAGPIYDDNEILIAVFIIHTDISKRKKFETELKTLYNSLQQQAKELAIYRDELDQFAHIASKDLNKPLKLMSEKLRELKTSYVNTLDEKGLEDIHYALTSSERMQHLISGLLEYTLTDRVNGLYEKLDLNIVLGEAQGSLRDRIHDKFAIINASSLPVIKGNRSHFILIFKTLISTILEYHDDKPQISIEVDSDTTHWLFFVRTEGSAKDSNELKKMSLFLEKPDADMDVSRYIAMATVRKLVGKYKGRIALEAEPHKRSTFSFTIAKNR